DFQRRALAYERTTFGNAGSLANKTNRNVHFDLAIFSDAQEIRMQNNFTYGVKLNFLEDRLIFFSFNVQMNEVSFIGVNELAKQNHRRVEMNLFITSVQYTGNKTFIPKFLRMSLAEICSFIPYNLNSFHGFNCLFNCYVITV